ncbi:DUF6125 family protein [Chloroflexota bacterium]
MEKLLDYSGELQSVLRLDDFSSDTLAGLCQVTDRLYCGLDRIWYSLIRERFGEEMARELDREVWRIQTPIEVSRCRQAMNIWGNDVASVLKFLQVHPAAAGVYPEAECELKDKNHGILTIKHCLGLDYYRRYSDWALQKYVCEILDVEGFQDAAHLINPNIKVTPLKLPSQDSQDDIACQWEFKLEE